VVHKKKEAEKVNREAEIYEKIIRCLEELAALEAKKRVKSAQKESSAYKRSEQIEHSKDFLEKAKKWSGQNEIAATLAWQMYTKAQAYIDQGDAKNAHRFYELTLKALKLCGAALKELSLEELEERIRRLEEQSV
jgi:tetratricopeptide (TPR) repeat protein